MKVLNYNENNLQDNEIDELVIRVKVFLFNSKSEILIAISNGGCQLPGGHIEKDENLTDGIIREIKEETGIELVAEEIAEPFYEINYYKKNYKNLGINRLSKIKYYKILTDKKADINNIKLTQREIENNFKIEYVNENNFIEYVNNYINNASLDVNKVIASEILTAYENLTNYEN